LEPRVIPLDGQALTLADVAAVARGAGLQVAVTDASRTEVARSRAWVVSVLHGERAIYGVNTGFGSLARVRIDPDQTSLLSRNLIRSHAAGVGPDAPDEVVRAMMLLRANALARGASGCTQALIDTLLSMLARGVTPRVPRQGSCGSSGDLAPLSHLGLVVFGEGGHARFGGELMTGPEAMARAGIPTLVPAAKEGLAMTNGAQMTTAIAALALVDSLRLVEIAETAAAMSIEALRGVTRAFHPGVHALRPYPGAVTTAANLLRLLAGSSLTDSVADKVQDAYSLRCTPVILGAVRDQLGFAQQVIDIELNSVTDNPVMLMDLEGDDVNRAFSAGLFHGEPVGMACESARIAVAEIASLSERRLFRLTTGSLSARLPPALAVAGPNENGLGMLFPQTTAASLVSENKAIGWPSTLDSIPTCEDQEDHVAMSTTAAWRFRETLENSRRVVAIELLSAARALRYRLDEDPNATFGAGARAMMPLLDPILDGGLVPGEEIEACVLQIFGG
jgi:histidine ammonia-lyase